MVTFTILFFWWSIAKLFNVFRQFGDVLFGLNTEKILSPQIRGLATKLLKLAEKLHSCDQTKLLKMAEAAAKLLKAFSEEVLIKVKYIRNHKAQANVVIKVSPWLVILE